MDVQINVAGLALEVSGVFIPKQQAVASGPEAHDDYPADFVITHVFHGGRDITMLVTDGVLCVRLPGTCEKGCPMASLHDLVIEAAIVAAEAQLQKERDSNQAIAHYHDEK